MLTGSGNVCSMEWTGHTSDIAKATRLTQTGHGEPACSNASRRERIFTGICGGTTFGVTV
jgi:hypothetical protein